MMDKYLAMFDYYKGIEDRVRDLYTRVAHDTIEDAVDCCLANRPVIVTIVVEGNMEEDEEQMVDIREENVEIQISEDGTKLWINAPNCVCRIQGIKGLIVNDMRTKKG